MSNDEYKGIEGEGDEQESQRGDSSSESDYRDDFTRDDSQECNKLLEILAGQPLSVVKSVAALANLAVMVPSLFETGIDRLRSALGDSAPVSQNTVLKQLGAGFTHTRVRDCTLFWHPGSSVFPTVTQSSAETLLVAALALRLSNSSTPVTTTGTLVEGGEYQPSRPEYLEFAYQPMAELQALNSYDTLDMTSVESQSTGNLLKREQLTKLLNIVHKNCDAYILLPPGVGETAFGSVSLTLGAPISQKYGWNHEKQYCLANNWVDDLPEEVFRPTGPKKKAHVRLTNLDPAYAAIAEIEEASEPARRGFGSASSVEGPQKAAKPPPSGDDLGSLLDDVIDGYMSYTATYGENANYAGTFSPHESSYLHSNSFSISTRKTVARCIASNYENPLEATIQALLKVGQVARYQFPAALIVFLLVRTNGFRIHSKAPYCTYNVVL